MISIKKYLEDTRVVAGAGKEATDEELQAALRSALRSILVEFGNSSVETCRVAGTELKRRLTEVEGEIAMAPEAESVRMSEGRAKAALQDWATQSARHMQEKAGEVKAILLVLARAVESLAERDQRCAEQIGAVTTRLHGIATLEDLAEIRASVERGAEELKASVERMTNEGRAAVEQLTHEVRCYQSKLETAEYIASRDSLTGLGNRLWIESELKKRMLRGEVFSLALLDIDDFKTVNDTHGHLAGDEVLVQFANELRTCCRASDVAGRWGGDEFIVLIDHRLADAEVQTERLKQWVCGNYTIQGRTEQMRVRVHASMGLAEYREGDRLDDLLDRADAEMYRRKSEGRSGATG